MRTQRSYVRKDGSLQSKKVMQRTCEGNKMTTNGSILNLEELIGSMALVVEKVIMRN